MSKKFSVPRGTTDLLPEKVAVWQAIEVRARTVLNLYGYLEIRTPVFEETELFSRSMGETSDVVQKQMLTLTSQKMSEAADIKAGGLSLRPEGTASIVRSYIQNHLDKRENLLKVFYIGPMFRGERPQKGRLRQFHQIGVEAIGPQTSSPYVDAEVIALSVHILEALGVEQFQLKINTLGTPESKEQFRKTLKKHLKMELPHLCDDCQNRYQRNVFRILDCKKKACQDIVKNSGFGDDWLTAESRDHFDKVKSALDKLKIKYDVDGSLVRGLDYYTHTVFEVSSSVLGSQDALCAGGRYDNLVEHLGGPKVDAVGFALGVERVLMAIPQTQTPAETPLDAYLIPLDENVFEEAFIYLNDLRRTVEELSKEKKTPIQFSVDMSYKAASLKSQMRSANKRGARYVLFLSEDEMKQGKITIKDMTTGEQKKESLKKIRSIIEQCCEHTHAGN